MSIWLGAVLARSGISVPRRKASCALGPGQRWRGAGGPREAGALGCGWPVWSPSVGHEAVRVTGACMAQSQFRRPFLPEVSTCGFWGRWMRERDRETWESVLKRQEPGKTSQASCEDSTSPSPGLARPRASQSKLRPDPRARSRPPRPLASYRVAGRPAGQAPWAPGRDGTFFSNCRGKSASSRKHDPDEAGRRGMQRGQVAVHRRRGRWGPTCLNGHLRAWRHARHVACGVREWRPGRGRTSPRRAPSALHSQHRDRRPGRHRGWRRPFLS